MSDRRQRPFFRRREGRVDEGFTQIDLPAVAEILREPLQEAIEAARSLPDLEAAMAGLVRRIAPRQIGPRRPGPEDPEHGVQHAAGGRPRPASAIRSPPWPEDRLEHGPLLVGQVHGRPVRRYRTTCS